MIDNCYSEREKLVIDLYMNQNKTIREIAKTAKKHGLSHGIAMTEDDDKNKNKSSSEKATHAYKLFDEGKKPIELAIELNLR
jgi:hypothetical protein